MKIKILIASICAALIIGGGIATVSVMANTPKNLMLRSVTNAAEDVMKRDEISPIINAMDGGSAEISISPAEKNEKSFFDDLTLSGKMYFGNDAVMVDDYYVKSGELKLSGDLYLSPDFIFLSEQKILNDSYGISLGTAAEDLKKSIFAYGSGTDYAIKDKATYDRLVSALEQNGNADDFADDYSELVEDYLKKCLELVERYGVLEKQDAVIIIDKEKIKTNLVSLRINGTALAYIITDLYKYARADEKIADFVMDHNEYLSLLFSEYLEEDETVLDLYQNEFDKLGIEVEKQANELKKTGSFEEISISAYMKKGTARLVKLAYNQGEKAYSLEIGADGIKKTDRIGVLSGENKYVYDIRANTEAEYIAKFTVNDEELFSMALNRRSGEFRFDVTQEKPLSNVVNRTTVFTVSGHIHSENGTTVIELDEFTTTVTTGKTEDVSVARINTTVTLKDKDKMPSLPHNYTRINAIKEKDVKFLLEKLDLD